MISMDLYHNLMESCGKTTLKQNYDTDQNVFRSKSRGVPNPVSASDSESWN